MLKTGLIYAPTTLLEDKQAACSLPTNTPEVHAVNTVACANGDLVAVWYGGAREGAQDVAIYLARYDGKAWGPVKVIVNHARFQAAGCKWIRRIGNPVLHQDTSGRWHLFVATSTLGGWACSRIEHWQADAIDPDALDSINGGFCYHQRLPLLLWPNISHSVRAPAYNLSAAAGGGFVLPAHFEIGKKYGVLLHFDKQGNFRQRQVLPGPLHLLQPWPVHYPDGRTGFFLRDYHGRRGGNGKLWYCEQAAIQLTAATPAAAASTCNNTDVQKTVLGSVSQPRPLPLSNPDSGITALADSAGAVWLARNPDTHDYPWRNALVLEQLGAGLQAGQRFWVEASKNPTAEYSYPSLVVDTQARVHLLYTVGRTQLRQRVFTSTLI